MYKIPIMMQSNKHHTTVAMLVLALAATTAEAAAAEPPPISIDVREADLHNVLRLLADTGRVNIVVPDHVTGRVTIKLRHVPWRQALAVVLRSRGLGMERIGAVIQVDTLENITARAEARARLEEAQALTRPLTTVMFSLSYAKAAEVAPLVRSMLSPRGRITIDARTNTLIVTDVVHDLERVRQALGR